MVAASYRPNKTRLSVENLRSRLADYLVKAQPPLDLTFNELFLIEHCDLPAQLSLQITLCFFHRACFELSS